MQKLFRPYLSLPELEHLCSLLSQDLSLPEAKTAYGKLFKLKLEAEIGLRQEAYRKKPTLLQRLSDETTPKEIILPSADLWETFHSNPSSLSPAQIKAAKTYGWQEGLMSQVESVLFEKEIGL